MTDAWTPPPAMREGAAQYLADALARCLAAPPDQAPQAVAELCGAVRALITLRLVRYKDARQLVHPALGDVASDEEWYGVRAGRVVGESEPGTAIGFGP